jgi:hypothetical protein
MDNIKEINLKLIYNFVETENTRIAWCYIIRYPQSILFCYIFFVSSDVLLHVNII